MTRRRRRKQTEHQNHERWLISYADFITLLFAFFVVLYSSAQVDKRKVGQLAMAIQVAFQQMGIFDASNTRPEVVEFRADAIFESPNGREPGACPGDGTVGEYAARSTWRIPR